MRFIVRLLWGISMISVSSVFADIYSQQEQSWIGQSGQLIRSRLGEPQETIHQADGKTYLLYEFGNKELPRPFPGVGTQVDARGRVVIIPPSMNDLQLKPNLQRCIITFLLNRQNEVIAAQMEGNDCGNKIP